MAVDWELREAGPADAAHTVLLLPGGMCSAGSFAELMAQPSLAGIRMVATTMPGQAGAPPPDDSSVEHYARLTSELAAKVGADVIVGFSMGAVVAVEMVVSGASTWAGCTAARAVPTGCARPASRCGSSTPRRATAG